MPVEAAVVQEVRPSSALPKMWTTGMWFSHKEGK